MKCLCYSYSPFIYLPVWQTTKMHSGGRSMKEDWREIWVFKEHHKNCKHCKSLLLSNWRRESLTRCPYCEELCVCVLTTVRESIIFHFNFLMLILLFFLSLLFASFMLVANFKGISARKCQTRNDACIFLLLFSLPWLFHKRKVLQSCKSI